MKSKLDKLLEQMKPLTPEERSSVAEFFLKQFEDQKREATNGTLVMDHSPGSKRHCYIELNGVRREIPEKEFLRICEERSRR